MKDILSTLLSPRRPELKRQKNVRSWNENTVMNPYALLTPTQFDLLCPAFQLIDNNLHPLIILLKHKESTQSSRCVRHMDFHLMTTDTSSQRKGNGWQESRLPAVTSALRREQLTDHTVSANCICQEGREVRNIAWTLIDCGTTSPNTHVYLYFVFKSIYSKLEILKVYATASPSSDICWCCMWGGMWTSYMHQWVIYSFNLTRKHLNLNRKQKFKK